MHLTSKMNLIKELDMLKFMPLQDAYQDFLEQIPQQFHNSYTQQFNALGAFFLDSLMGLNNELPVLILNCL